MTWLIGWLLFGLLAVREVTGLASTEDRGLPIALCLLYGLLGATALVRLCLRSVRRGRAGALYPLCALCLLALGAIAWRARESVAGELEITALMASAAYLALSLLVGFSGLVMCWRARSHKRKLRREQQQRGAHRERLDRMGMPISPELEAMGLRPEDDPWPAPLDGGDLPGLDAELAGRPARSAEPRSPRSLRGHAEPVAQHR